MQTDVLIVGGGLSGLSLARQLQGAGVDYHLVEARSRFGGRIQTQFVESQGQTGYFDTGPAWFWPGQPRLEKLVQELGLKVFLQYAEGELNFEDERGQVFPGQGYASMAGSYRLDGGLSKLVDGVRQQLDSAALSLGETVTKLEQTAAGIGATSVDGEGQVQTIHCQRVVLALPPRVAAERIVFEPELEEGAIAAMTNIPTWMAGQAKIITIYNSPFWREAGFSGDAMSRRGPLAEIHDASPAEGGPYALFGFVAMPAQVRQQQSDALKQAAVEQLGRLFAKDALQPIEVILKDWAFEPETATPLDAQPMYSHPAYGLPHALSNLWQGQLMLGSTEVAANFGGYLEGALESAEMVFRKLM